MSLKQTIHKILEQSIELKHSKGLLSEEKKYNHDITIIKHLMDVFDENSINNLKWRYHKYGQPISNLIEQPSNIKKEIRNKLSDDGVDISLANKDLYSAFLYYYIRDESSNDYYTHTNYNNFKTNEYNYIEKEMPELFILLDDVGFDLKEAFVWIYKFLNDNLKINILMAQELHSKSSNKFDVLHCTTKSGKTLLKCVSEKLAAKLGLSVGVVYGYLDKFIDFKIKKEVVLHMLTSQPKNINYYNKEVQKIDSEISKTINEFFNIAPKNFSSDSLSKIVAFLKHKMGKDAQITYKHYEEMYKDPNKISFI